MDANDDDQQENDRYSNVEENDGNKSVNCEFCNKSFVQKTILRHIGWTESCKKYYGPRFVQMKKDQAKKRVYKQRELEGYTSKKHMKKLKQARKSYSKNEELKEKKRQYYQENKNKIKEKNAEFSKSLLYYQKNKNEKEIEELSLKRENLNILDRNTSNLIEILDFDYITCEHCKNTYDPNSILKHIGNNKECRSFYGQSFEKLKKEKNNLRQVIRYASDPDMRKRQKDSSKKAYKKLKNIQAIEKEKEKIEKKKKDAKIEFEYKKITSKDVT